MYAIKSTNTSISFHEYIGLGFAWCQQKYTFNSPEYLEIVVKNAVFLIWVHNLKHRASVHFLQLNGQLNFPLNILHFILNLSFCLFYVHCYQIMHSDLIFSIPNITKNSLARRIVQYYQVHCTSVPSTAVTCRSSLTRLMNLDLNCSYVYSLNSFTNLDDQRQGLHHPIWVPPIPWQSCMPWSHITLCCLTISGLGRFTREKERTWALADSSARHAVAWSSFSSFQLEPHSNQQTSIPF